MKLISKLSVLVFVFALFACENEVDINTEFNEVTAVYGLLDIGVDTQFVKVTRTFLDENQNAIQLAGNPDNLYYDSLKVELVELDGEQRETGRVLTLSRIVIPKEGGIFTTEENEAYFTSDFIDSSKTYTLNVTKPDGSITSGSADIVEGLEIRKPSLGSNRRRTVPFVNFRGQITPFIFEFSAPQDIGEFEMEMTFRYIEILNNDSVVKEIIFPLGNITNPQIRRFQDHPITFNSDRLFTALENSIPIDANAPKRIIPTDAVTVEINSADSDYTLYRDVYGPIDGLAQTRAEYTNITNGIGLFSSRRKQVFNASINDDTENFIIANYGDINNLAQFRNFQFP